MKSGYIYVLNHPSDPNLFKIGQTSRHPQDRLLEHNSDYQKYAGQIVYETGQKWELKTYFSVPDPRWAEQVFWTHMPMKILWSRNRVEVVKLEWEGVEYGLEAAKNAGTRPPPAPNPDYVYKYTASMKKRLEGRGISVLGYVRSKSGKSNFRCDNGHKWRAHSNNVAEGEGCPECGIGDRTPEEIWQEIRPAYLCLLTHPDRAEVIKIELTYRTLEQCFSENIWDGWEIHRYRFVEEPELAKLLIWELLGCPRPECGGPIEMELSKAEQAIRSLVYRMDEEIALAEKAKELIASVSI